MHALTNCCLVSLCQNESSVFLACHFSIKHPWYSRNKIRETFRSWFYTGGEFHIHEQVTVSHLTFGNEFSPHSLWACHQINPFQAFIHVYQYAQQHSRHFWDTSKPKTLSLPSRGSFSSRESWCINKNSNLPTEPLLVSTELSTYGRWPPRELPVILTSWYSCAYVQPSTLIRADMCN
jgi:hypothetical protein